MCKSTSVCGSVRVGVVGKRDPSLWALLGRTTAIRAGVLHLLTSLHVTLEALTVDFFPTQTRGHRSVSRPLLCTVPFSITFFLIPAGLLLEILQHHLPCQPLTGLLYHVPMCHLLFCHSRSDWSYCPPASPVGCMSPWRTAHPFSPFYLTTCHGAAVQ